MLRRQNGQDIIEYALILPFLLLLTFSIIEGGWLIFRYNTVANAAREGARAGIISASATCNDACVEARARSAATALMTGLDLTRMDPPTIVLTDDTVKVTVTYNADLITAPFVQTLGGSGTFQLRAAASMQRE